MLSAKNRIRLILGLIALVAWGATLLSLLAINRMIYRIDVIVSQDAAIAGLGERINVRMLEARRDEKNFIIYFDSTYLAQNRNAIIAITGDIQKARSISSAFYSSVLDSLEMAIAAYSVAMTELTETYRENPRILYRLQDQMREYEKELQGLVKKRNLNVSDFPSLSMDFSIPLLSAAMKVSSDQARLFSRLRDTSSKVQQLAQTVSSRSRENLAKDAELSVKYGMRAQKWIFVFLILAAIILNFLIVVIPRQVFLRIQRLNRSLQAMGRGETDVIMPVSRAGDEVDTLSENFSEAIQRLKYFNTLKTEKIIEIERNLRRIIDEVDEAVLILSDDFKITHLNRSALTMFEVTADVVRQSLKVIPALWNPLNEILDQIEKNGRTEVHIRLRKRDLKKSHVTVMPIIGLANRLETVVIFIR